MKNDQLRYYEKHNISPERQNIDNITTHYARREKLYRQCGLPVLAFRDADVLEIGPGGGYNTLAYFEWGCRHIDLVEANPQGIQDMRMLFREQRISQDKYEIFDSTIEDYHTIRKYDIVIAEGFLSDIYNQREVIEIIKGLINEKGIVVITCVDKIGFFIESMKRLTGVALSRNIPKYEEKVRYLTDIFKPQLEKLRGVSKLPEDWVKDIILNPGINNGIELSLGQAIHYFEKEFDILGTSPSIFTDYSWYKDIWYDYKKDYLEQFDRKRLSFLMANMPEVIVTNDADILVKYFGEIRDAETEYEKTFEIRSINHMIEIMNVMKSLVQQYFGKEFLKVFEEIKEVLLCVSKDEELNMERYPHFFAAFGRTQQYISFVKK